MLLSVVTCIRFWNVLLVDLNVNEKCVCMLLHNNINKNSSDEKVLFSFRFGVFASCCARFCQTTTVFTCADKQTRTHTCTTKQWKIKWHKRICECALFSYFRILAVICVFIQVFDFPQYKNAKQAGNTNLLQNIIGSTIIDGDGWMEWIVEKKKKKKKYIYESAGNIEVPFRISSVCCWWCYCCLRLFWKFLFFSTFCYGWTWPLDSILFGIIMYSSC